MILKYFSYFYYLSILKFEIFIHSLPLILVYKKNKSNGLYEFPNTPLKLIPSYFNHFNSL